MGRTVRLAAPADGWAGVVALLALLVWKGTRQPSGPRGQAPNFARPRIDRSGDLELASLRGKAVVLNFWASWCGPCKEEAPLFESLWRNWRGRGVVVVGVDAKDFSRDALRFMRRYGVSYPVAHDGPGKVYRRYGLTGFPETFVVGRSGKIVAHIPGAIRRQDLPEVTRHIRRALRA